jgi:hypothetical protein
VKRHYKAVRKGKHVLGIGLRVRRERLIHQLRERNRQDHTLATNSDDLPTVPFEEQSDTLPLTPPTQHYHMSASSRQKVHLTVWLHKIRHDPAVLVSIQCGFNS